MTTARSGQATQANKGEGKKGAATATKRGGMGLKRVRGKVECALERIAWPCRSRAGTREGGESRQKHRSKTTGIGLRVKQSEQQGDDASEGPRGTGRGRANGRKRVDSTMVGRTVVVAGSGECMHMGLELMWNNSHDGPGRQQLYRQERHGWGPWIRAELGERQ